MLRGLIFKAEHDKIAVFEGGVAVTYLEIAQKALAVSSALSGGRGQRAAIFLPDGSEFIAAFFAVISRGMAALPINTSLTEREVLPLAAQADVCAVITTRAHSAIFERAGIQVVCADALAAAELAAEYPAAQAEENEPLLLLATSGTTGNAKVVQLSERNVLASTMGYIDKMRLDETPEARFILATPFSTAYGMMILTACLLKQIPVIPLDKAFTLDVFYKAAEAHGATHYEGGASVLQMMERMAGRPIPYDISRLRIFGFGGSKISGDTVQAIALKYPGLELYQGYGMTEAGPLIAKFRRGETIKPDSVGSAINDVEIAVEAANGQLTRAPHTKGEIVARGPNIMLGYYKNDAETKKAVKDGWLHTGDIGYLDEQGFLYLCGRKKSVIIVRGFNVHPEEVEECLLSSGLVADCVVYGGLDAFGDETVCADAVPISSHVSAEAVSACCNQNLAEYKRPKIIRFCPQIEKNASGKSIRLKECS